MTSSEIREAFLKYFERQGHARVASSSLVPAGDPTLYFTNAGMVQFKEVFLGEEQRPYKTACSSQKCMRVSGKHNDLENVGFTPRHHTFFEMLGNFSFGDYFKKEAIAYAWEFLTKEMKLPKEKLYVTVFEDDDEAEKLWTKHVAKDRIFRMGEEDNFWAMGPTGPCGPCSEIHWDWGTGPVTKKDFAGDRLFEIWNLVFMQFNRDASGKLHKLAKPSVDTGMGLERLSCLMQNVKSNYETDLFAPIIQSIKRITGDERRVTSGEEDVAMRVIADHIRGATFLIADGVLPSNDGRGYVLRRILRRAIRYSRKLNVSKPMMKEVSQSVIQEMKGAYPALSQHQALIEMALETEEVNFLATIDRGMEILEEAFASLKKNQNKILSGASVFKLYDTFGFPKDLTELIARERGVAIDEVGFETAMKEQQERARAAWKGSGGKRASPVYQQIYAQGLRTKFVGYEKEKEEGEILCLLQGDSLVDGVSAGEEFEFVTSITPFYAEGGGQVGDTGVALKKGAELIILDTQKPYADLFLHRAQLKTGTLEKKNSILLEIDHERRQKIRLNHTATHLLHAALRQILGEHVKQAGSYLNDEHLRFDFSHFSPISDEQLADIESLVNQIVKKNLPVRTDVLAYPEAIARGALAFFGEKYGDVVRMVQIPGFSTELCGGTHVSSTGEIGQIKVVRERSVASGVRRIEAISGLAVDKFVKEKKREQEVEKQKALEKEQERKEKSSRSQTTTANLDLLMQQVREVKGVKVLACVVFVPDAKELREVADRLRQKLVSGIVAVGAEAGGKAAFVVMVTPDLIHQYKAGDLIKKLTAPMGGTGGGRSDMAQGGAPEASQLTKVLESFPSLI